MEKWKNRDFSEGPMVKNPPCNAGDSGLILGHWGQEEKGTTEDEMAGWHLRFMGSQRVGHD